ncbi:MULTISPECIES: cell division protein FtsB [unclassified Trinickia]|uniref:cell division protein FtsB n=1 Tax=unclassified Trinickia TaxID=2638168 RepID=UPI002406C69F|nr:MULTISPECIES: cell division protein FtsB [unclassified Trinickia]MDG0023994.1 cell division protein FtsB [Trinickia sp. Y13]HVW49040.1 cell division protein FtsB [Trinickia sp.]
MRLVTVALVALLALIQYPLWWGHGGWLRVHELRGALAAQQQKNADEKLRNERIEGEVQDLQNGTAAVEERARYEMGMVKGGEVFVQFVSPNATSSVPATAVPSNTSTRGEVSAAPVSVVPNPVSRERPSKAKKHAGEKSKRSAARKGHGAG